MTDAQIRDIVRSEMKKTLTNELNKGLKTMVKNGDLKKNTTKIVKDALEDLYKFMWVRKGVWRNEIGR